MSDGCPICATPLEGTPERLVCGSCRACLWTRAAFAQAMDLADEPDDHLSQLNGVLDRYGAPLAACSFCPNGQLRRERVLGESVGVCSECRGVWVSLEQQTRMKSQAMRRNAAVSLDRLFQLDAQKPKVRYDHLDFDSKLATVYAFPVALILGALGHVTGLSIPLWLFVPFGFGSLPGAIVAWLGGFPAQPISTFTLDWIDYERRREWVVVLTFVSIVGLATWAWKRHMRNLLGVSAVLLVLQVVLTFVVNEREAYSWRVLFNPLADLLPGVALMAVFYCRFRWRWDFWRYVALAVGALLFVHPLIMWLLTPWQLAEKPNYRELYTWNVEAAFVRWMVSSRRWKPFEIEVPYIGFCLLCLAGLTAQYVAHLPRWTKRREGNERNP